MLLNWRNFYVHKVAAKEDSRYALNGVHFTPEGTVACDGRRLLHVTPPDLDGADFPQVPGFPECGASSPPSDLKPFTISTDSIPSGFEKPLRSSKRILEGIALDVQGANANGEVRFARTDLAKAETPTVRKVEGEYPRWQAVVPKEDGRTRYRFSAELLGELLLTLKRLGAEGGAVDFYFAGPGDALLLKADLPDGQKATAVLMPMGVEV